LGTVDMIFARFMLFFFGLFVLAIKILYTLNIIIFTKVWGYHVIFFTPQTNPFNIKFNYLPFIERRK